jgi:hypothetical protein
MTHRRFGLGRLAAYAFAAVAIAATPSCNSEVFDVEDPQAFGNADLDNVKILKNVADGAEGLLHQAFDDVVVVNSLLSDQIESMSTWIDWEDISEGRVRADWPTGGSFSGPMDQLLRARFAAQDAAVRIQRVLGADAAKSPLMSQVQWVEGMSDLLIGMSFCEGPLQPSSARAPDTEFYKQAVTKLTTALTTAQSQNDATWINVIRASRARANLLAGNFDAALADAQAVTSATFSKVAVYNQGSGAQQSTTGHQFHQNRNRSGGLRRMYFARAHVVDTRTAAQGGNGETYLRDWFDATKDDKRMALTRFPGQLGVNNRFDYYGITKYNDYGADQVLISKRELNLIEAEVYYRKNDFANVAAKLNIDRVANGLPAIPTPANAADALNAVLNERFAVLFVEGQRANDLYRFGLVRSVLGAGRATKLPMSRTEIVNNSSMKEGEGRCPAIS